MKDKFKDTKGLDKAYMSLAKHYEERKENAIRQVKDGAFVDLLNQEIEELQKEKQIEEMTKVSFSVIDNKTGEYPDLYDIALKEDWAKGLMYCDMEGFSINEDGQLILSDECGKFVYCPSDRFTVVFEDSVVLSREEQDKLYQKGFNDGKEFAEKFYKPLVKAETSKETAEKFLNMIYWKAVKHIKGKNKDECFIEMSFEKLDELAKQYGVEIKE